MVDVSNVKAGKYELVALRWDEPKSKPGEPFDFVRHRRGDVLDLNTEEARRLVAAGAVVKPGERERAQRERARQAYEAAQRLVPDDLREDQGEAGGSGTGDVVVPDDFDPDDPGKHGLKVVQSFLATASEEDRDRVIDAEADRTKPRKGVVEWEPPASSGDDTYDA